MLTTYVVIASLIAFFTVKIVGVPIGRKMTAKIVLSIIMFTPIYVLLAYLLSKLISGEIEKLNRSAKQLPFNKSVGESFISEVDSLANTIRLQAERIMEILEAQRFLLIRMAHDLRTPITNVRNVLQAIKEGVIGKEESGEYIDRLIMETQKMEELIEEILADMRRSVRKSQPERLNLSNLLREIVEIWKLRFDSKGLELLAELEEDIEVYLSPVDLQEVINNLLENALNNTERGRVKVSLRKKDRDVEIEISDSGTGIQEGEIMKAYRQGRLGIYIVKELVWRNGGSLEMSSGGAGSSVKVRFPLR